MSEDNDLPGQIQKKGDYFIQNLEALQKKHSILVDVIFNFQKSIVNSPPWGEPELSPQRL